MLPIWNHRVCIRCCLRGVWGLGQDQGHEEQQVRSAAGCWGECFLLWGDREARRAWDVKSLGLGIAVMQVMVMLGAGMLPAALLPPALQLSLGSPTHSPALELIKSG